MPLKACALGAGSAFDSYTKSAKAFEAKLGGPPAFAATSMLGGTKAFDTSALLSRMTDSILAASRAGAAWTDGEPLAVEGEESNQLLKWLAETPFSLERAKYVCDWLAAAHAISLTLQWYLLHRVDGRELIVGSLFACLIIALHSLSDASE